MPPPKYFKAWLIFFAIATVGGGIAGGILGAILGLVLGLAGVDLSMIKIAGGVVGFLVGVPISYFTFRWVVATFIVNPLTQAPPAVAPAPPANPPTG